jgi:hypothetical protein
MDMIKAFFSRDGWKINWKSYIIIVAGLTASYILGALGGAMIQAIKDAIK